MQPMRRRALLAVAALLAQPAGAWAQTGFSDAIGVLASERSLAEQGAAFVKGHAPDDIDAHALYAQAKAAFDGLIEQLLADVAQGDDPQVTADFRAQVFKSHSARVKNKCARNIAQARGKLSIIRRSFSNIHPAVYSRRRNCSFNRNIYFRRAARI